MFARILKAGMLVLAAVTALSFAMPASAADWRGGHGFHARVFRGSDIGNRYGFRNRSSFHNHHFDGNGYANRGFGNDRFAMNDSGWRYGRRNIGPNRLLRRSSSSSVITSRGSGVTVILSDRPDVDVISNNYAGSGEVFTANGGTYVTGFGYSADRVDTTSGLRPKAKIIDAARAPDPCSHENGVCVIRAQ